MSENHHQLVKAIFHAVDRNNHITELEAEVERLRGLLLNIDLMAIDDLTHGCEGRLTSQIEAAAAKGENP